LLIDLLFKTSFIEKVINVSRSALKNSKPSALVYLTKLGLALVTLSEQNEDYAEFLLESDGWKDFYIPEIIEKHKDGNQTWEDFKNKKKQKNYLDFTSSDEDNPVSNIDNFLANAGPLQEDN